MTKPVNKRPTTAAAVVALTARAAPPDPRAGVTSETRCVSTPTCAARPSAKGADTLQKRQVRSASVREREAPAPTNRRQWKGIAVGAEAERRGTSPHDGGGEGSITARRTKPAALSARVKPIPSMRKMSAGAISTPPRVAPLNARLTARPRRRWNQGARMMSMAAEVESHPRSLTPGRARRMVRASGQCDLVPLREGLRRATAHGSRGFRASGAIVTGR